MSLSAFFLIILSSVLSSAQSTSPVSLNLKITQCKEWSKSDWDKFIQSQLNGSTSYYIFQHIQRAEKICPENMSSNSVNRCVSRILGYYGQFLSNKGGMFSSRMSDDEYIKSQPEGVLELPSELANSSNGLPTNWKQIAEKNGWKWVLFHSDTANEPRLVFYIPGKTYNRLLVYYSFNTRSTDPSSWVGLQMQAIENKQEKSDGKLPKYYFKSWGFDGHNKTPKMAYTGGRCVDCHISGPRAVVPQSNPKFSTQWGGVKSVSEFNELIVKKGNLDYSPYYDEKYFPNHLQIGKDCVLCHDGKDRSSLARSIDSSSGEFNLTNIHRKVVIDLTMPREYYGPSLDPNDREKMVLDIEKDFKDKLNAWLTETPCDPANGKSTVNTLRNDAKDVRQAK